MNEADPSPEGRSLRTAIYAVLIATSIASCAGRLFSVSSFDGKTPFLSANDRSRWCTIRALADEGTYSIDHIVYDKKGKRNRNWHTIDMVRHRGADGREHYYSSKPPLIPTIMAGGYWALRNATGATLEKQPFYVGRILIIVFNLAPLLLFWISVSQFVEARVQSSFGQVFVMGCATWGTYLSTFAVTLNNHLHAAVFAFPVLLYAWSLMEKRPLPWWRHALAGLAAGFLFASELPGLALGGLTGLVALRYMPKLAISGYLPAFALVVAGMLATNYLAHGTFKPAYNHREDGKIVATAKTDSTAEQPELTDDLRGAMESARSPLSSTSKVEKRPSGTGWMIVDEENGRRFAIAVEGKGDGASLIVREWTNWYEYNDSYWLPDRKRGVDLGEPSPWVYAIHTTVGHHGVVSLTPIWSMSIIGLVYGVTSRRDWRGILILIAVVSLACFVFYLSREQLDRNYGGVTNGLRWTFWLIPLFLVSMAPAADLAARSRSARFLAIALLAMSVFSAAYKPLNPWNHPWIYDLMTQYGYVSR